MKVLTTQSVKNQHSTIFQEATPYGKKIYFIIYEQSIY